jgi:hypothetical protein
MFLMVRLALRSIELEIHPGIENIPVTSRSSIQGGFDAQSAQSVGEDAYDGEHLRKKRCTEVHGRTAS